MSKGTGGGSRDAGRDPVTSDTLAALQLSLDKDTTQAGEVTAGSIATISDTTPSRSFILTSTGVQIQPDRDSSREMATRELAAPEVTYQPSLDSDTSAAPGDQIPGHTQSTQPATKDSTRRLQDPDDVHFTYSNPITNRIDPSMRTPCLDLAAHVFGRPITEQDFAQLTSAVSESTIDVFPFAQDAIVLDMFGPGRHVGFTVARLPGGDIQVHHISVHNYDSRSVTSAAGIVDTMLLWKDYGVTQVTATALRLPGYNGYSSWAKIGFVGDIPEGRITSDGTMTPVRALAQAHFASYLAPGEELTRVEHLMRLPGGYGWWKRHGGTWTATFHLTPGSYSMQTLAHLRRHGAQE